jgi:hypothetical protein
MMMSAPTAKPRISAKIVTETGLADDQRDHHRRHRAVAGGGVGGTAGDAGGTGGGELGTVDTSGDDTGVLLARTSHE